MEGWQNENGAGYFSTGHATTDHLSKQQARMTGMKETLRGQTRLRSKAPPSPYIVGGSSMGTQATKPTIPAANTAYKKAHTSRAPLPKEPPPRPNAEPGPSRPSGRSREVMNSRKALRPTADKDDDSDCQAVSDPFSKPLRSKSPVKDRSVASESSTRHTANYTLPTAHPSVSALHNPKPFTRTMAAEQNPHLTRGSKSRSPEKPGPRPSHKRSSTSRSKSPAKSKGHPDRPEYIDASKSEVQEVIEHPDGPYKEDFHEIISDQKDSSDIELVEGPAAMKELGRRLKGRPTDIEQKDEPIVKQADRKGKGKAVDVEMPDPRDTRRKSALEDKGKTVFRDEGGRSDTRRISGSASPDKKTWPLPNFGPGPSGPRGKRTIDTDLSNAGGMHRRTATSRTIPTSDLPQTVPIQEAWCDDSQGTRRRMMVNQLQLRVALGYMAIIDPDMNIANFPILNITRAEACGAIDHPFIEVQVTLQNQKHQDARRALIRMLGEGKFGDHPTMQTMQFVTMRFRLEDGDGSSAFIFSFRDRFDTRPGRCFDLNADQCHERIACAPSGGRKVPAESHVDDPVALEPTVGLLVQRGRTDSKRNQSTIDHMESDIALFDASSAKPSKGKGKGRETDQSVLAFHESKHGRSSIASAATSRPVPVQTPASTSTHPRKSRSSDEEGYIAPATAQGPARRSHRISHTKAPVDICSDDEAVEAPVAPKTPNVPLPTDRETILFPYPLEGRSYLNITKYELWRVMSGEFLNDTLIEWGLRHLMSDLPPTDRSKVHLFNSFFYNKISSKDRKMKPDLVTGTWPAYQTVRKWTKNVDIFEMDYIIVPINEDFHWYLAVIVNPGGILAGPKQASASSSPAPPAPPAEDDTSSGAATIDEIVVDKQLDLPDTDHHSEPASHDKPRYVEIDEDDPMKGDTSKQTHQISSDDAWVGDGDDSVDPLDILPPHPGPPWSRKVPVSDMRDLYIRADSSNANTGDLNDLPGSSKTGKTETARPAPAAGRPIQTLTLSAFKQQDEEPSARPLVKRLEPAKAEPKKLEDHKIWNSGTTWIITFDSLGTQHKGVGHVLSDWLKWEAKTRKEEVMELSKPEYTHAQVPLQPNFSDCGLYLVHYARRLLERPEAMLKFVQRRLPHKYSDERKEFDQQVDKVWGLDSNVNLRGEWQAKLYSLQLQWEEQERKGLSAAKGQGEGEAKDGEQVDELEDDSESFIECVDMAKPSDEEQPGASDPPAANDVTPDDVEQPPPSYVIAEALGTEEGTTDGQETSAEAETSSEPADVIAGDTTMPITEDVMRAEDHGAEDRTTDGQETSAEADTSTESPESADVIPGDTTMSTTEDATRTAPSYLSDPPAEPTLDTHPTEAVTFNTSTGAGDLSTETTTGTTSSVESSDSDGNGIDELDPDNDNMDVGPSETDRDTAADMEQQILQETGDTAGPTSFPHTEPDFADDPDFLPPASGRLLKNSGLQHPLNAAPDATSTPIQNKTTKGRSVTSVYSDDEEGNDNSKELGSHETEPGPEPRIDHRSIFAAAAAANILTPSTSSRSTANPFSIGPDDARKRKEFGGVVPYTPSASSPRSTARPVPDTGTLAPEPSSSTAKQAPPAHFASVPPWKGSSTPVTGTKTKPDPIEIHDASEDDTPMTRNTRQRRRGIMQGKMVEVEGNPGISVDSLDSASGSSLNGESDKENIAGTSRKRNLSPSRAMSPPSTRRNRKQLEEEASYDAFKVDERSDSSPPPRPVRRHNQATYGGGAKRATTQSRLSDHSFATPKSHSEPHRRSDNQATPVAQSSAASKRKSKAENQAASSKKAKPAPPTSRAGPTRQYTQAPASASTSRRSDKSGGTELQPIDIDYDSS